MGKLTGAKEICKYLGIAESTFMDFIKARGLPAKLSQGVYTITTAKLDKWLGVNEKTEIDAEAAQREADAAAIKAAEEKAEAEAAEKQAAKAKAKADAAKKK